MRLSTALACAVLLFVSHPVCFVHAQSSLEPNGHAPPKLDSGAVDAPDDNREAFKWLRKCSVTLYGGQLDSADLGQIFYSGQFEPSSLVALAISREFARWGRYVAWEVEGEGAKHFSQSNDRLYELCVGVRCRSGWPLALFPMEQVCRHYLRSWGGSFVLYRETIVRAYRPTTGPKFVGLYVL